jgi:hypothetical protein
MITSSQSRNNFIRLDAVATALEPERDRRFEEFIDFLLKYGYITDSDVTSRAGPNGTCSTATPSTARRRDVRA